MSPRLRGVFAVVGLVLVGVTARYALPFLGVWVFPLMFLSLGGVLAAGLRGAGLVWGVVWVGFFLWADWRGYGGYLPGGWVWLIGGVEGSALVEYAIRLRRDRALLLRVVEGLMEGAAHPVMVSVGGRVWVNARLCEEWMLRIEPGKGYPIESVSMLLGGASVEKLKGMLEGREEEAVLEVGGGTGGCCVRGDVWPGSVWWSWWRGRRGGRRKNGYCRPWCASRNTLPRAGRGLCVR